MRNYRTFSSLKLGVIITATFFIFGATVTNAAPIKVLSNGNHGYSRIVDTINQLLGVGHVGTDIIVHRNTLSTLGSISPNEAFSSDTRYDESGVAVSSQAPYHLFTTSSTGYGGDSITTYNLTDTYDYAFNFPITVSTNSPPPAFHIAPGGGGWASFSGVEWTTDPNVFPASSLSGLAADNAGILAVLRYQHPTWNWFDVKAALRQSGTNWDTGYDDTDYGFGIVSYATTTAYADNEILLQPPVASAVLSGYVNQIVLFHDKSVQEKWAAFLADNDQVSTFIIFVNRFRKTNRAVFDPSPLHFVSPYPGKNHVIACEQNSRQLFSFVLVFVFRFWVWFFSYR